MHRDSSAHSKPVFEVAPSLGRMGGHDPPVFTSDESILHSICVHTDKSPLLDLDDEQPIPAGIILSQFHLSTMEASLGKRQRG